jgi:5'-nucleotidase
MLNVGQLVYDIQDISLAKNLLALSPAAQKKIPIAALHGADILLGGHDHLYYVAKGVTSWQDFDITKDVLGAEDDNGDILVVKSGCDFRDLSEMTLELDSTPPGSVRNKVIKSALGMFHSSM